MTDSSARLRPLWWLLLALGAAATVFGWTTQLAWPPQPWKLWREPLGLFILILLGAGILRLTRGSGLFVWAVVLALALQGIAIGVASVTAVALLALWALALGSSVSDRPLLALLAGFAMIAGALGWLLPWSIHSTWSYGALALLSIMLRAQPLSALLRTLHDDLRVFVANPHWMAWLALGVLAYVSTAAWLPTSSPDDLGYHLALPYQLQQWAHYRLDAETQVWALSPWASDLLQAIAQLLAGREARGALNTLWLLLGTGLLAEHARAAGLGRQGAALAIALWASQPLTFYLGISMQSELPTAVVLLACAALCMQPRVEAARADTREGALAGLLVGLALGFKISNLAFLGPIGLWWLLARRPNARPISAAVVCTLLVAGSSYTYAYVLTGNPVLPIANEFFQSAHFSIAPITLNWREGIDWMLPFNLQFATTRYFESWNGVAGFQWLALLPMLALALALPRWRVWALVGIAGTLGLLLQMQYLRYLYPGFLLLTLPLVAATLSVLPSRAANALIAVLALANVGACWNVSSLLREGTIGRVLRAPLNADENFLREKVPERIALAQLRASWGNDSSVLIATRAAQVGAEMAGAERYAGWYEPALSSALIATEQDSTGKDWSAMFDTQGFSHVLSRVDDRSEGLSRALGERGALEFSEWPVELHRIQRPALAESAKGDQHERHFDLRFHDYAALEISMTVRCEAASVGFGMRFAWRDGLAQVGEQSFHQRCPSYGDAQLRFRLRSPSAADAVVVKIDAYLPQEISQLAISEISVRARRDHLIARDQGKP